MAQSGAPQMAVRAGGYISGKDLAALLAQLMAVKESSGEEGPVRFWG